MILPFHSWSDPSIACIQYSEEVTFCEGFFLVCIIFILAHVHPYHSWHRVLAEWTRLRSALEICVHFTCHSGRFARRHHLAEAACDAPFIQIKRLPVIFRQPFLYSLEDAASCEEARSSSLIFFASSKNSVSYPLLSAHI